MVQECEQIGRWKSRVFAEPARNVLIEDLRSDTQYTIRVRANDPLGPGKLSNAITVKTIEAGEWTHTKQHSHIYNNIDFSTTTDNRNCGR